MFAIFFFFFLFNTPYNPSPAPPPRYLTPKTTLLRNTTLQRRAIRKTETCFALKDTTRCLNLCEHNPQSDEKQSPSTEGLDRQPENNITAQNTRRQHNSPYQTIKRNNCCIQYYFLATIYATARSLAKPSAHSTARHEGDPARPPKLHISIQL